MNICITYWWKSLTIISPVLIATYRYIDEKYKNFVQLCIYFLHLPCTCHQKRRVIENCTRWAHWNFRKRCRSQSVFGFDAKQVTMYPRCRCWAETADWAANWLGPLWTIKLLDWMARVFCNRRGILVIRTVSPGSKSEMKPLGAIPLSNIIFNCPTLWSGYL